MPKPPAPTSRYWHLQRQLARFNTLLFRKTGGKVGGTFFGGAPVLLLDHVGRKSGQLRTSPLIYFNDASRLVIVASKGGVDAHPAWFHNLMAMATTEVELPGGERRRVRPRVAEGAERVTLWERAVATYKPYATYATYTEREIPVIVLEPADVADPGRSAGLAGEPGRCAADGPGEGGAERAGRAGQSAEAGR